MFRKFIVEIVEMAVALHHRATLQTALERQYDVQASLQVALARVEELRASLARRNADFDWLAQRLHEVNLERAQLYARIGVNVPVPEIARAEAPRPPVDDYVPPARLPIGDILNKARDIATAPRNVSADLGELSFEDMGDEQAAAHGLAHNDAGEVVPTR